jgi:hypothetical protein
MPSWTSSWYVCAGLYLILLLLAGCGSLREGADSGGLFGDLARWGHLQDEADRH